MAEAFFHSSYVESIIPDVLKQDSKAALSLFADDDTQPTR